MFSQTANLFDLTPVIAILCAGCRPLPFNRTINLQVNSGGAGTGHIGFSGGERELLNVHGTVQARVAWSTNISRRRLFARVMAQAVLANFLLVMRWVANGDCFATVVLGSEFSIKDFRYSLWTKGLIGQEG